MDIDYAAEKLTEAMDAMALGVQPLPDRLEEAYFVLTALSSPRGSGLPTPQRVEFEQIMFLLQAVRDSDGNRSLRATLEQMSESDAVDLALRIRSLADVVNSLALARY